MQTRQVLQIQELLWNSEASLDLKYIRQKQRARILTRARKAVRIRYLSVAKIVVEPWPCGCALASQPPNFLRRPGNDLVNNNVSCDRANFSRLIAGHAKTNSEDIHHGSLDPFDPKASPLPDLPESKKEVIAAAQIFGSSSVLLLGPAATDAAFEAEPLGGFRIIDIAAHGIASANYPDRAALVFAPDPAGHDDGLLQVRQIRKLHLNADLVTLSACDTGAGRLEGEEGIENIERAFLYAGARSVLASLWLSSDTFTFDLMKQFYRNLAADEDEGEALRQAKLSLMKKFSNKVAPSDWAGFTLVGNTSLRVQGRGP